MLRLLSRRASLGRPWQRRALAWGLGVAVALAAVACGSPAQRRATLAFFFDGVPEEGKVEPDPGGSRCVAHQSVAKSASRTPPEADPRAHVPFRDGRCQECHTLLLKPLKSSSELCLTCHKAEAIVPKNAHSPVAEGDCAICHFAHTGPNTKLLRAPTQQLCTSCHDFGDKGSEARHRLLGDRRTCTDCHLAHGGDGPSYLRPPSAAVCGRCHEMGFTKFKNQHSPAEGYECYECHTQHGTDKRKLLTAEGEKLCANCHDSKDLRTRAPHNRGEVSQCTKCHDPHGSGRRFLLRTGPAPEYLPGAEPRPAAVAMPAAATPSAVALPAAPTPAAPTPAAPMSTAPTASEGHK